MHFTNRLIIYYHGMPPILCTCLTLMMIIVQVIHNVGLCIALWDIVKMEDSYIFPMDGSSHTVGKLSHC